MIKNLLWICLLAFGAQTAWAFSLLGPGPTYSGGTGSLPGTFGDTWQVVLIGYNPRPDGRPPPFIGADTLAVGPKNLGEEYRRNTPVMYYAADANFLDYFGSNGVVALDNAFAILDNVFTNTPAVTANGLDAYSAGLTEFPLNTTELNYQAVGLRLVDLKSWTLALMMEQLGLADAIRYTWVLHDRYTGVVGATCIPNYPNPPGPGTGYEYLVVQRNFDITASPLNQVQYSPYVNGGLYTYEIIETCSERDLNPPSADAVEVAADPLFNNPPVASGNGEGFFEDEYGQFYTGLTRDDVAGLRYLLSTNNVNTETPASGSQLENTNNPTTLVTTSDLGALVTSAQSNSPAVLAALFPGVVIGSSTSYFTNVSTPNVIIIATNYNGEPFGTPPHIITITNGVTWLVVQRFVTTFANVATISYHTNSTAMIVTTTFGAQVGAPAGSPFVTKTSTKTITLTNTPTGDYYFIPAGTCGLNVVHDWQTNVVYTTNLIAFAVNPDGSSITESLVTYYTNHILEVLPCNFAPSPTALYQGIGRMQFFRRDYDSLLGQFYLPITNVYTMVSVTNGQPVTLTFQRVVTVPDFLFDTVDQLVGPNGLPTETWYGMNINLNVNNIYPGLAGPGTINPSTTITFNKVGPVYFNLDPYFMNGPSDPLNADALDVYFLWGSFDGTTNDPVVYPNGSSIQNLESQVLLQIYSTPATLPPATNGFAYSASFSATGGQPPYTWSLGSGTQLPQNLTLSTNGVISGVVGNSTNAPPGVYVFTVQLNDSSSEVESLNYFITVY